MKPGPDGLLLVDKESGCTSHDVVQRARRILGLRKIGHCGTLDPTATGLLVLTLGRATRLTRFLINAPKVYSGTIRFGIATDTYDASGKVVSKRSTAALSQRELEEKMQAFEGTSEQAAPAYSAKKIGGVKYYELARRGEEVPKASKEVTIYDFHALNDLANDRIDFQLGCSSGTYVRTVAHDLGDQLGCGAHLEGLRRLRVGPFELSDAATLDEIDHSLEAGDSAPKGWIEFDSIPLPFEDVNVDTQQETRISHGQAIVVRESVSSEGDWVRVISGRGRLIAVGSVTERIGTAGVVLVQPRIVFG